MTVMLPHLDTDVVRVCNCACRGCNHLSPMVTVKDNPHVRPEDLGYDLERLAKVAHSKAWAALGGEPTIHPDLVELLIIADASGIADEIEVWTNGTLLRRMRPDFWDAVDRLVLSAYPGKIEDDDIYWISNMCGQTDTDFALKDARSNSYFTSLMLKTPVDAVGARRRHAECWYRTYTHNVNRGYFYKCCTSPWLSTLMLGLDQGHDGLALDGITEDGLRAFLGAEEPLASCSICLGHNGPTRPWIEVRGRKAWVSESGV